MFAYKCVLVSGSCGTQVYGYRSDRRCAEGHHPSTVLVVQIMHESTLYTVYVCGVCLCLYVDVSVPFLAQKMGGGH